MPLKHRLEFWPSAITLAAFILCTTLGVWQLYRLTWKEDLIERLETRLSADPVSFEHAHDNPVDAEFLKVSFSGVFHHDKEMYFGQYFNGTWGYNLVTPMTLDSGGHAFVNRGWVPSEMRDPAKRPDSIRDEPASLVGIIRRPMTPRFYTPENNPAANYWFWADLPAMQSYTGVSALPFVIEVMDHHTDGGWPLTPKKDYKLRNDHLQYAFTWFALAISALTIGVLYHRKKWRENG